MEATPRQAGSLCVVALTVGSLTWSPQEPVSSADRGGLIAEPLSARSGTGAFVRLSVEESGIDFRNDYDWGNELRDLYDHGFAGGGVAIGDVNGDRRPDIYLVSETGRDTLWVQTEGMRFEDATSASGLAQEPAWGSGAGFADVDGDGDLDLYVCNYDAPNRLNVNRGDGTFSEEAASRGLAFRGASVQGAFADYDRDGDLDLYLVTNRLYPGPEKDVPATQVVDGRVRIAPGGEEAFEIIEADVNGELQKYVGKSGQPDRLFANSGDGHFVDVTEAAGLFDRAPGLSAVWWDPDGDLYPDLYVANDFFAPDRFYRNQGDGRFHDDLAGSMPHTTWFSMGTASGDLDGDGRPDLVVADMSPTTHYRSKLMMGDMGDSRWFLESAEPRQYMRNAAFRNTGTGRFMEMAFLAGLASTDWTWSVKLADLDCDGRLDAFFSNGSANNTFEPDLARAVDALGRRMQREGKSPEEIRAAQWELYRSEAPRRERNLAFHNRGDWDFHETGQDWGLGEEVISYGAALGDLDRDGDLDLVVNHLGEPAAVYANGFAGRRNLVRLSGRHGNTWGIGATLVARTAKRRLVRTLYPESGYMSSDEPMVHLGLGDEALVSLTVRWPSGHVQIFDAPPPDHLLTIVEPLGDPPPRSVEEALAPRFQDVRPGPAVPAEVPFDDFARQPLLPARLSRTGPGLCTGDVNGDGRDDFYLGGSSGHAGSLWLGTGDGGFERRAGPWSAHADREDTGVLWLDADQDGDLDLYVARGSIECEPGDGRLRDALYLNEGDFLDASERLPEAAESSSAVCAADYDRDGDLDLFVGARSIPGRYPEVPRSRLLEAQDGRFVDVTDARAPALERVGLVTAALWMDVEGDGDPDLLVASEWGPVSLFRNDGARLVDATAEAGLSERLGWWNGIAAGDVDQDGDLDLLVTNAGWNTKYHADPEHPALLFHGDVEGTGRANLVEAKSGEQLLPVRGLSCSADAMPTLRKRIPTYEAFASATLAEIYAPERLQNAGRLAANELASGLLLNESRDGALGFSWKPLPRLAQASAGRGVVLEDLDGDGHVDAFLLQNLFAREPETGRWDGGVGALLDGDGTGALSWVEASRSGIVAAGEGSAVVLCDANGDGRADLLTSFNEGPLQLFLGKETARTVALSLSGPPGNPAAIGARIRVENGPGAGRVHELTAGSGYLSQSAPRVFLRYPPGESEALRVHIRWPDGRESVHELAPGACTVALEHP